MEDIYSLLREDSIQLESQFRKSSIEGKGASQEIADFRENAVKEFLSRFFPFPHRLTKGKVRDSFGAVSNSVDCVICAANHPYTVDSQGKFTLLFAEGVDAAIEVKPNIGDSGELERGLVQGLSVKALRRAITPGVREFHWGAERAKRVPYVIFAMRCKTDPLETATEILDFYASRSTAPVDQADFVVVNGVGLFTNIIHEGLNTWDMSGFPNKTGWFFEQWGEDALAGFLWRLHGLAHASMKLQDDVLPRYLVPAASARFRVVDVSMHPVRRKP
jgi:hypothetical protein